MEPLRIFACHSSRSACNVASRRPVYLCKRCLQTSACRSATPLPHLAAAAPPPEPPTPASSGYGERIDRRRRQAELLQRGQALRANPAKPSTALQKRFWKDVSVKETPEGLQVLLDTRPVRTASKNILHIPHSKHQLATAIALEWDLLVTAQQALKQHYIPLTSVVSRAVDIQNADAHGNPKIRESIVQMLLGYLETDTLLCWAPEKNIHEDAAMASMGLGRKSLRQQQIEAAQPIMGYLTTQVWPGVEVRPVLEEDSIMPASQPQMTKEIIRGWITGLPAYELAGLERGVLASKSLLVATRLLVEWSQELAHVREGHSGARFGIEEAADACTLEVRWQTGMWGEVEDTHDVDHHDIRRQLGQVVALVSGDSKA